MRNIKPRVARRSDRLAPLEPCAAVSEFTLWQLADSAFPTGGFAHSAGLEGAWQHGEVRDRAGLLSYLETSLDQLGHASLPFVNAAHTEPERLNELDQLCEAFTTNHVANRASRAQGKALLLAVERVFPNRAKIITPRFCHLPPLFGVSMRSLDIPSDTTARLFFFNHLRGLLAAAVRLNIIGPMEAQAMQHRLSPLAEQIRVRCSLLGLEDLAQTSPLLDLWQGAQDRLYSRLFQS